MTADDIQFHIEQDRKRVRSILALPEARGREKLASVLAYQANMTIDDARAALNAAPSAAEPAEPKAASKQDEFDWGEAAVQALLRISGRQIELADKATDAAAFDFGAYDEGAQAAKRLLGKGP